MRRNRKDYILAFLLSLSNNEVKGRYELSKELGIGEGVLRGIYQELREGGLITVGKGGTRLTPKGLEELEKMLSVNGIIHAVFLNDFEVWGRKYIGVAAALRRNVKNVVEARDAAVRSGAHIALIAKREADRIFLPMVEEYDLLQNAPQLYSVLASLPPAESYAVVLGDNLLPCVKGLIELAKQE